MRLVKGKKKTSERKVEILSPGGSLYGILGAIAGGCDAVYVGGTKFGARAYADNLSEDLLESMIKLAHLHGKKLYLTVNTLLKEEELEGLLPFLHPYYELGLDGILVQDLGVAKMSAYAFPALPIHLSTQMNVHSSQSLSLFCEFPVTRIVPARELSLEEIRVLREKTDLEIECFVHGALCYSYSGQCLLSSFLGGRSGNRGRCAQPCRGLFQDAGHDPKYALCLKDFCALARIPDLVDAGVDSFKIEGRMKKPAYAAYTAYLYRKYTDLYLESGREGWERYFTDHRREVEQDFLDLSDLYNRGGFCEGYLNRRNGPSMFSFDRPNHYGVQVGEVKRILPGRADASCVREIHPYDVLELRRNGKSLYEFTVSRGTIHGESLKISLPASVEGRAGDLLFRTRNAQLLNRIERGFLDDFPKAQVEGYVSGVCGDRLRLTISGSGVTVKTEGGILQPAVSHPLTPQSVERDMRQTGGELCEFSSLSVFLPEDCFLNHSEVKRVRRAGFYAWQNAVLQQFNRTTVPSRVFLQAGRPLAATPPAPGRVQRKLNKNIMDLRENSGPVSTIFPLDVSVSAPEQAEATLSLFRIRRVILPLSWRRETILSVMERCHQAGKEVFLSFPRICREEVWEEFEAERVREDSLFALADGVMVSDLGAAAYVKSNRFFGKPRSRVLLNHTVSITNHAARDFWMTQGFSSYVLNLELTRKERLLLTGEDTTLLIYGHVPVMVTAQCQWQQEGLCAREKNRSSGRESADPSKTNFRRLTRGEDTSFYAVRCCKFCYQELLTGGPLVLWDLIQKEPDAYPVGRLLYSFTRETGEETAEILAADWRSDPASLPYLKTNGFTRGHEFSKVE